MPSLLLLLLLLLLLNLFFERIERLKNIGVEQGVANRVQLLLDDIQILVKSSLENIFNGAEMQFCEQPAAEFLGLVVESARGDARNRTQSDVQHGDAKLDRARKIFREQ